MRLIWWYVDYIVGFDYNVNNWGKMFNLLKFRVRKDFFIIIRLIDMLMMFFFFLNKKYIVLVDVGINFSVVCCKIYY